MTAILCALASALLFGTVDYIGGALGRRENATTVMVSSQSLMTVALIVIAVMQRGRWDSASFVIGLVVGSLSGAGVILLYRGLAQGVVGIVAPVAAVVAAIIPGVVGALRGDAFHPMMGVGIVLALVAIVALSQAPRHEDANLSRVMTPTLWLTALASGLCLSATSVGFAFTDPAAGILPLVGVGMGAVITGILFARYSGVRCFVKPSAIKIATGMALLIVLAYLSQYWAVQHGTSLAVIALVVSLYPVPTILWARVLDKEKMTPLQYGAVALALVAVAIMAITSS